MYIVVITPAEKGMLFLVRGGDGIVAECETQEGAHRLCNELNAYGLLKAVLHDYLFIYHDADGIKQYRRRLMALINDGQSIKASGGTHASHTEGSE